MSEGEEKGASQRAAHPQGLDLEALERETKVVGLRVPLLLALRYEKLDKRAKRAVREALVQLLAKLLEQPIPQEVKRELEVVVRHEVVRGEERAEESTLRLYRRIETLERELAKRLEQLEETKNQLEAEKREKQKCIQELEAAKRKPEDLARQVAELKRELESYHLILGVLRYCMESDDCDPAKLNDYLRSRVSKIPYQKPPDSILAVVRRPK